NASKVRSDAAQLPVSVLVYTTRTFTGDQAALDNDARSRLSNANAVDIAIDTVQRHLSIQSGSQVKLSDEQASNAVDAFKNNFDNGDYTGATIAAIDSIHDALTNGSSSGGMTVVGIVVASVLGVIFLGIIVLVIVGFARNRRRGGPPTGGGRRWGNQEWNRGYYPYPAYNNSGSNSNYGGGASGNFGGGAGGSFGGGAGGSFGGGAGGSF
ncbi:MAG: TPM domain-containing protein, partial [Ktedonobacteraceae bacterium]|nr:TPM domain-containing protein [Ktedonobacteraceae bacterium]